MSSKLHVQEHVTCKNMKQKKMQAQTTMLKHTLLTKMLSQHAWISVYNAQVNIKVTMWLLAIKFYLLNLLLHLYLWMRLWLRKSRCRLGSSSTSYCGKIMLLQCKITLCITDNRSNPVSPEVELSQCLEPRKVSNTRYIISSQVENSQVCQVTQTLYLTNLDEYHIMQL